MFSHNVVIKSLNPHARKVLLLSHGGYTPQRNHIMKGSGKVCIPAGITLFFNSEENRPSIGTKAIHLLDGFPLPPVETKQSGCMINNYSLEHNEIFERLKPTLEYDLITISPRGKLHMSDIFNVIRRKNKNYNIIHYMACRIDKINYSF